MNLKMNLAILFWCYKDIPVCENRLQILRKFNPEAKIFCLYGGEPSLSGKFEQKLGQYLDDFYCFSQSRSNHWKWYHGDRMIAQWFEDRGHALDWDSIFVAQWDMLVIGRLERLFQMLKPEHVLMSGLRPVSHVDPWWYYLRKGSPEREEYDRFLTFVEKKFDFVDPPLCGQFLVVCLPREFISRYCGISEPELGFLEYKVPIYAQIFGFPFCVDHPYLPWWGDHPESQKSFQLHRCLHAQKQDVPLWAIESHRMCPWGRRIFHPLSYIYPIGMRERLGFVAKKLSSFYKHML